VPSDKGMSSGLILVLGPRLGKGRDDALNASSSHVQELPADVGHLEGQEPTRDCPTDISSLSQWDDSLRRVSQGLRRRTGWRRDFIDQHLLNQLDRLPCLRSAR